MIICVRLGWREGSKRYLCVYVYRRETRQLRYVSRLGVKPWLELFPRWGIGIDSPPWRYPRQVTKMVRASRPRNCIGKILLSRPVQNHNKSLLVPSSLTACVEVTTLECFRSLGLKHIAQNYFMVHCNMPVCRYGSRLLIRLGLAERADDITTNVKTYVVRLMR